MIVIVKRYPAVFRMIFDEGYVHCDPHPGNVLVDRQQGGNTQIVLLDHGLYTQLSNKFRSGLAVGTKFEQQFCMKTIARNLRRAEPSKVRFSLNTERKFNGE